MKNGGNKNVASTVREIISPVADELGYYIWDVEFVKEGADKHLRITIDNEDGITIEDCEKFHRAIDAPLDEEDPIAESYILEVSSPGIERELKTPEHIAACVGEVVEAKLFAPLNGSRTHRGTLAGQNEAGEVVLRVADAELCIPKAAISRLTTVFEF